MLYNTDKMNLANVASDCECPQARARLYNHHLLLHYSQHNHDVYIENCNFEQILWFNTGTHRGPDKFLSGFVQFISIIFNRLSLLPILSIPICAVESSLSLGLNQNKRLTREQKIKTKTNLGSWYRLESLQSQWLMWWWW